VHDTPVNNLELGYATHQPEKKTEVNTDKEAIADKATIAEKSLQPTNTDPDLCPDEPTFTKF
jgi:hypothetical protein